MSPSTADGEPERERQRATVQIEIDEVVSQVRAIDGEALLDERVLRRIVAAVCEVLERKEMNQTQAKSDRATRGVHHDLETGT